MNEGFFARGLKRPQRLGICLAKGDMYGLELPSSKLASREQGRECRISAASIKRARQLQQHQVPNLKCTDELQCQ